MSSSFTRTIPELERSELLVNSYKWRTDIGKQKYEFSNDLRERANPRCQLCQKTCYKAEIVSYNSVLYHKECFRCLECLKKISPAQATPIGDKVFACNAHINRVLETSKCKSLETSNLNAASTASANTSRSNSRNPSVSSDVNFDIYEDGLKWRKKGEKQTYKYPEDMSGPNKKVDPRCNKCGKTSYKAETVSYERIPYHNFCFKCLKCRVKLVPGSANPFGEDTFLCNTHFKQAITQGSGVSKEVYSVDEAPKRPKERTVIQGTSEPSVDLTSGLNWRKEGNKQKYNYPEDIEQKKIDPRCHKCGKKVYRAEKTTFEKIPYHHNCFRCLKCKKKLSPGNATPFGNEDFLCNVHFNQVIQSGGSEIKVSAHKESVSSNTSVTKRTGSSIISGVSNEMHPDIPAGCKWRIEKGRQTYKYPEDLKARTDPRCNKCGKKAYRAEVITYERVPYHRIHFRCLQCNKMLHGGNAFPFGEDVFLCDTHFSQYGQGAA